MKSNLSILSILIFLLFSNVLPVASQSNSNENIPDEPENLVYFKKGYPDVTFSSQYISSLEDWKITMEIPEGQKKRKVELYWCEGRMIPYEELKNKDKYWTLLYKYDVENFVKDPATFSEEDVLRLKINGSDEKRKNGPGTPMFFFDSIYGSTSQVEIEKRIKTSVFLDKNIRIHQRIIEPLSNVEKRIKKLAKTSKKVENFIGKLRRNEAYYWRLIANTNRKSFHSLGIAIDVQPVSYEGKDVYWSWAKDRDPKNWMLTPLANRWMPPEEVVKIFEEEGFIWGGKWAVWDNMHFEYHPELIMFSKNAGK